MGFEAIKLELIEWLTKLEDGETIEYLKIVKDSKMESECWEDFSPEQKSAIECGVQNLDAARDTSNQTVKRDSAYELQDLWTAEALKSMEQILMYIAANWSDKEVDKFKHKLSEQLNIITSFPKVSLTSSVAPRVRKAVLEKVENDF